MLRRAEGGFRAGIKHFVCVCVKQLNKVGCEPSSKLIALQLEARQSTLALWVGFRSSVACHIALPLQLFLLGQLSTCCFLMLTVALIIAHVRHRKCDRLKVKRHRNM